MVDQPRFYLDVNIFIYWLGNHPKYSQTAREWIRKVEDSAKGEYVTSALTLYETLVIIGGLTGRNFKDKEFVSQVIAPINSIKKLRVEPLNSKDFQRAVELMAECNLDYEDALHMAVALRTGAKEMVSNDKDYDATTTKRTI